MDDRKNWSKVAPSGGFIDGWLDSLGKRCFDLLFSVFALLFAAPLFLLLLVFNRFSVSDTFYLHARVGKNGGEFSCIKLRSMVKNSDEVLADYLALNPDAIIEWQRDNKLRNDPRITRLGLIMRRYSLDELPQFINVIRGDMSVVGPRPITRRELEMRGSAVTSYLKCRPGITGLWQVSGRSETSHQRRVALDKLYASRASWCLDAQIVAKTGLVVLKARGSW